MRPENMKFVVEPKLIPRVVEPTLRENIQEWVSKQKNGATSREVNDKFCELQPRTIRDHLHNSVAQKKLKEVTCRCKHATIYHGV